MEVVAGSLAATRQTWRKKTVRELLADIIRDAPNAGEEKLRRLFRDSVREDEEYFLATVDYAFDAALRALLNQQDRQPISAAKRAEQAAASAQRAAAHAKVVKGIQEQILLLNQEMPNGKRMRFCTGAEMATFGEGYRRIAKKVGTKTVGTVLDEAQVRELMQS